MNNTTKIVIGAVVGIAVGAASAMAFSENAKTESVTFSTESATTTMSMQDEMTSMNQGLQGKTGDAFDKEFLSEMTIHHQGAVAMAQLALQNAKHTEVKQLAQGIIAAQDKEIVQMQSWQKSWYGAASSTAIAPMQGMHMGQ
jgi:uncharacterized protein (DUF305 family)